MFKTPILLIAFNRPGMVQQVFDVIKLVKPKFLFIAVDGPREDYPEDVQRCIDTRKIIEQVDWDCELKTFFRAENRGCGYGPAEAITWFFENVEDGIILEDDCLPEIGFFRFCRETLEFYRENHSVFVISGFNPLGNWRTQESYIICKNGGTWGWATWKRAWQFFDHDMRRWSNQENLSLLRNRVKNERLYQYLIREFTIYGKVERKQDVWDYQWLYARIMNNSLCIVPKVNLISNIGFGEESTHTSNKADRLSRIATNNIKFPLKHPRFQISKIFDWIVFEKFMNPFSKTLLDRAILKLVSLMYRF